MTSTYEEYQAKYGHLADDNSPDGWRAYVAAMSTPDVLRAEVEHCERKAREWDARAKHAHKVKSVANDITTDAERCRTAAENCRARARRAVALLAKTRGR